MAGGNQASVKKTNKDELEEFTPGTMENTDLKILTFMDSWTTGYEKSLHKKRLGPQEKKKEANISKEIIQNKQKNSQMVDNDNLWSLN